MQVLTLFSALVLLSSATTAQTLNTAWVDPNSGCDTTGIVNDPTQAYFTLQAAVDAVAQSLGSLDEGLVIARPGLYQNPVGAPFAVPLLRMKPRVNVQGVGARRCILRGSGVINDGVFWPDMQLTGTSLTPREVLVSYNTSADDHNYKERLDGFTLQGGDVQVHFEFETKLSGTISNCIFDMRVGYPSPLGGPTFGIEMVHLYNQGIPTGEDGPGDAESGRYWKYDVNILNNTFILGQLGGLNEGGGDAPNVLSLPNAVGIIDVNDPFGDPLAPGSCFDPLSCDPNQNLRRIGAANVQNNLVRSLPEQLGVKDMLGIDATDTTVALGFASPLSAILNASNAFRSNRTSINGFDTYYSASANPVFAVDLATAVDPAFVGEALADTPFGLSGYRDWRLLPGSPLVGLGARPSGAMGTGFLSAVNGTAYTTSIYPELSSFDWDMEGYGNPRIVGDQTDIGADESHLYIMAGSYSNDDTSHNLAPGVLNPDAGVGRPVRYLIFPSTVMGSPTHGVAVAMKGTNGITALQPVPFPPTGTPDCPLGGPLFRGWYNQPGTLFPPRFNPLLPFDYRFAYVSLTTANAPLPWNGFIRNFTSPNPLLGAAQPSTYGLFAFNMTDTLPTSITDVESGPTHFNTQAVVQLAAGAFRSNLQSEFR